MTIKDEDHAPPLRRKDSETSESYAFGNFSHFAPSLELAATTRASRWYLPNVPATSAFGDTATLTGSHTVIDVSLAVGYRIAL